MNSSSHEDNFLFRCPLCLDHIFDSQIHEHIQHCEFYSQSEDISVSIPTSSDHFSDSSFSSAESEESYSDEEVSESIEEKRSISGSEVSSIATCPICYNNFNENSNLPRMITACGHTVCELCLKNIKNSRERYCCPICRKNISGKVSCLPVNFVLLELKEPKIVKRCLLHNLELVAFCVDDDLVLCGACIFDHKDHSCTLLTDPALEIIAEEKKKSLKTTEKILQKNKELWTQSRTSLEKLLYSVNVYIEMHKGEVLNIEEKMIQSIQEGASECISQLRHYEGHSLSKIIAEAYRKLLNRVTEEIQKIQEKQEKFERLPMAEKLMKSLIEFSDIKVTYDPAAMQNFSNQIDVFIDYKSAIDKKRVF